MTLTRDEIMQMPADVLRVAIAHARHISVIVSNNGSGELIDPGAAWTPVPNWPANIADAWVLESEIPQNKRKEYALHCARTIARDAKSLEEIYWRLLHASPLERSRAWLLWDVTREGNDG